MRLCGPEDRGAHGCKRPKVSRQGGGVLVPVSSFRFRVSRSELKLNPEIRNLKLELRAMSTYVYVKRRLHPGLLDEMLRAGAETIEIFGARGHFNYTDREHVREVAAWFRTSGITLNSMHSPMYS